MYAVKNVILTTSVTVLDNDQRSNAQDLTAAAAPSPHRVLKCVLYYSEMPHSTALIRPICSCIHKLCH